MQAVSQRGRKKKKKVVAAVSNAGWWSWQSWTVAGSLAKRKAAEEVTDGGSKWASREVEIRSGRERELEREMDFLFQMRFKKNSRIYSIRKFFENIWFLNFESYF